MKTPEEFLRERIQDSLELKNRYFDQHLPEVISFYEYLKKAASDGKQVFILGNGGSAADAQHLAAELLHRVEHRRIGIKATALHTDSSVLTALGNDEGFEHVFGKQLEVLAGKKDLVVAITTSGNSTNIIEGLRTARKLECKTVGLLGRDGGKAAKLCDLPLVVEHASTPRIQEVHGMIIHLVCQLLEQM